MGLFTDLINGIFSLLPDFVEDNLEDKIPFHTEDGKLTVSDWDANKDNQINPTDGYIHRNVDSLGDLKKKLMKFDDAGDITDKLGELTNKADDVKNVVSDIFDAINKLK
ncbi:MAG: hypothetical protein KME31_19815 [Tolypothrix carrinoi HA7290-LM1]|jgi:hypothetical protein|nr:hypothetical protein [Tolypothrix carrinoi HA7290-LM1]